MDIIINPTSKSFRKMLQFFLDLRLLTVNDAIPGSLTRLHIRSECEKASSGAVSQIHLLFPSPLSLSLFSARQQRERGRWLALAKGWRSVWRWGIVAR